MSNELELNVLRHAPQAESQASLASQLGFSVGKTHYVLNALIDKGLLKAERFSKSNNKFAYRYVLTPEGIAQRIRLTESFIQIKQQEYQQLQDELSKLHMPL